MLNPPSPNALSRIPPLYATPGTPSEGTIIHGRFYLARCNWFATAFDGEDEFFGYVCVGDPVKAEWGHFSLAELNAVMVRSPVIQIPTGQRMHTLLAQVEWDACWQPKPFSRIHRP